MDIFADQQFSENIFIALKNTPFYFKFEQFKTGCNKVKKTSP